MEAINKPNQSKSSRRTHANRIVMYADAFIDYQEAADNIRENGAVVAHPKTGAPFDNPYLKVRQAMLTTLRGMHIETGDLWDE